MQVILKNRKIILSSIIATILLATFAPFNIFFNPQTGEFLIKTAEVKAAVECQRPDGTKYWRYIDGGLPAVSCGAGETEIKSNIDLSRGGPACSLSPSTWDICLSNLVYVFTVGLGSTFAFIGAYFFDVTVSLALNSAAYAQSFISQGWTVARDLANMGFILALVYLAYTIMLKAESSGTMRMLAWVIVIALIINFSFFFTRLVIDAGNILAVQFYNAIPTCQTLKHTLDNTPAPPYSNSQPNCPTPTSSNDTFARTKDLTHPIMNGLNMQGLLNTSQFDAWYKSAKDAPGGFITAFLTLSIVYIAVGAMYFILAVMFLTAGIKFLVRIVVLWFLIIVSPLAFIAKTTRISDKYYDLWQSKLIAHVFYPVVFLFIFLFIALVMSSMSSGGQGALVSSLFGSMRDVNASNVGTTIPLLLSNIANVAIRLGFVVAMLYIGMKAADTVGVYGANTAKKFTGWAQGRTLALGRLGLRYGPGWAAGAAYRNTVARGANEWSKKLAASEKYNKPGTFRGVIGYRLNKNILKPVQQTSLGTVASSLEQREDFLKKRRGEMESNLDKIQNKKDAERMSQLNAYDVPGLLKKIERRDDLARRSLGMPGTTRLTPEEMTELGHLSTLDLNNRKIEVETKEGKSIDALKTEHAILEGRISKFSGAQIVNLGTKDIEGILKQMSESQLKAVLDSDKFKLVEKEKLEKKWHEESKNAAVAVAQKQVDALGKLHSDLDKIGYRFDALKHVLKPDYGSTVTVNLKGVEDLHKDAKIRLEAEEKVRDDRTLDDAAGKARRNKAGQNAKKLRETVDKLEKLTEEIKKVPEGAGNKIPPAEFEVKNIHV